MLRNSLHKIHDERVDLPRSVRLVIALIGVIIIGLVLVLITIAIRNLPKTPEDPIDPTWTEDNVKASKACGEQIIIALEAYRKRTNHYPHQLEDLVPADLPSLTPPTAGDGAWIYGSEDAEYGLSFQSKVPPEEWYFQSRHPFWGEIRRDHF
jgi:hypothetical protein